MNFSITILDALIVLIIIVSAGYAAWRGFLWETLTIFEWVAAAFACLYFGPYLIPMARSMVDTPWLASVLAYAVVFLTVFIPLAFISYRFSESVKHSPIGPLDRAAGVAFGVVRGLVILGLAYLAFTYFVPIRNQPRWVTQAELLPVVQTTADVLLTVVPDQSRREYGDIPHHDEVVRQAPAASHDPVADLIHGNGNAAKSDVKADAQPEPKPAKNDAMGELIRRNQAANSVPKTTREPAPAKPTATAKKSYGAGDRQALDKLVETGGNGTR